MNIRNQILLAALLVLVAIGIVFVATRGGPSEADTAGTMDGHDHSAMSAGGDEARPVSLTDDQARRIGVTFATVTRGALPNTVRTIGSVGYDERLLSTVSPKVEGWVETLFVDFTGAPVRAGQPLLELYSPALVTAQEELLLAVQLKAEAEGTGGTHAGETADRLVAAARQRLAYWDISPAQIEAIESGGAMSRTLTLRSPASGVVIEKDVVEGTKITPGAELFRIADLSSVWVEVEIYEKDLGQVAEGTHAMVYFEAYPGESFHGNVTYVYPTVSPTSRTGRVRLELPNPEGRLKPGMYAQVELHGQVAEESLLIPRSAVLHTGDRSIVFHRMGNGQLHPMEIQTGRAEGDQIQVLSGLREGHVVVQSATFLIDAESNLGAAMAAMAGMDHSSMDMGSPDEMDHSGHDMGSQDDMDHSGHDMGDDAPADSTAGGADPHAGHGHEGVL